MILNVSRSWAVLLSLLLHSIHLVPVGGLGRDQLPLSQESPLNRQNAVSGVISASPLLSFHRSICQIESTTNGEQSVGDYLFSYLKKRGFHALRQEVPVPPPSGSGDRKGRKKRFNVFAWPQEPLASTATLDVESEDDYGDDVLGDFAPQVILTSHMDTVPPFILTLHWPLRRPVPLFRVSRTSTDQKFSSRVRPTPSCPSSLHRAIIIMIMTLKNRPRRTMTIPPHSPLTLAPEIRCQ